jgi:hypothetical protein
MKLPRIRFTMREVMLAVALTAAVVAVFLQRERFARRETELKKRLVIARELPRGYEGMRALLGDMGIVIARSATKAEVLRVTGPYQVLTSRPPPVGAHGYYPVSLTGEMLDATLTRRLACELLEPRNYIYIGSSDLPEPKFGVRMWRGKESLDVLFNLDPGHIDVWAFLRDERGELIHGDDGWICFGGDTLERLVRKALVR